MYTDDFRVGLQYGVVIGVLAALVIGFITFRIDIWMKRIGEPFKPQKIVQVTKKSPWQVVLEAIQALLILILFLAMLVAVAYIVFSPFFPGT